MSEQPPVDRRAPNPMHDALIAGLGRETHLLREAVEDVLEVKRETLQINRELLRRAALTTLERAGIWAFVLLLVVFAFVNYLGIREMQRGTALIQDCTTPSGQCYQRSRAQTAGAVGSINTVTQIAVVCADQFDGRSAIEACINDRLHAAGLK